MSALASAPAPKPASAPTTSAPKPPAAPAPTLRSVKDTCAGGNIVARSLCELRECRKPAHAAEAYCVRLIREDEERRQPKAP